MATRFDIDGVDAATAIADAAPRILAAKAVPMFALETRAASGTDMDAVHDMRVASRRLRAAMDVLAPCYRKRTLPPWERTVARVTRALGGVRDADVFIDAFRRLLPKASSAEERVALAYLIGFRQGERVGRLATMHRKLARLGLAGMRTGFAKAIADTRGGPVGRRPLGVLARATVEERIDAMFAHLPAALDAERIEEQHAMRISGKRLRYAVETLAPCFGDGFDEAYAVLVEFQDVLGDLHDLDVFTAMVREVEEAPDAAAAGVTVAGLERVVADLAKRRKQQFTRFTALVGEHPGDKVREMLLGAMGPDAAGPSEDAPA